MASSKASLLIAYHLILLFLVTSLVHDAAKPAFADEQLIREECQNAEVPETCIRCVKSDGGGESANKIGIAAIVIKCLSNHDDVLAGNMSTLVSSARDNQTRTLYQDCHKGFLQSKDDLSKATKKLKSGDYDQTNHFVRTAVEPELACRQNVTNLQGFPSAVLSEMTVYEELTVAALRIIDRF